MPTHSIWSQKPIMVRDGNTNTQYNSFKRGDAAALWTEHTRNGYFKAVAVVSAGDIYEFTLTAIGNSDAESITGLWDIVHNGALVCNGCVGQAYGLNQPAGTNYFKIYIGDQLCYQELWHFSGYITRRFDF
jgi:hypothetical protein